MGEGDGASVTHGRGEVVVAYGHAACAALDVGLTLAGYVEPTLPERDSGSPVLWLLDERPGSAEGATVLGWWWCRVDAC